MCDIAHIPVENNRFDLVILTQVLEHISDPKSVLGELHRVLKPLGELWLIAPLLYEEHEVPYDYYRYTQYGLKYLLEVEGFTIIKIIWLEGYFGTLSYQLSMAARSLPTRPEKYGGGVVGIGAVGLSFLLKPAFSFLSLFFSRMDLRNKYTDAGMCKNYALIARKESAAI